MKNDRRRRWRLDAASGGEYRRVRRAPGDFWGHFQCPNGERSMAAEGGVMARYTGLTLPQCLDGCSRATGPMNRLFAGYFVSAT